MRGSLRTSVRELAPGAAGFQVGGQVYQALVLFDDGPALARFKQGPLELSADVSGVIVTAGYVVTVRSTDGVTVFARPIGGFMGEVSVAGERFTFAAVDPAVDDPGGDAEAGRGGHRLPARGAAGRGDQAPYEDVRLKK